MYAVLPVVPLPVVTTARGATLAANFMTCERGETSTIPLAMQRARAVQQMLMNGRAGLCRRAGMKMPH